MHICESSVEFIGVPGSGKSTLYKHCINSMDGIIYSPFSGVPSYDVLERVCLLFGFKRSQVDAMYTSFLFRWCSLSSQQRFKLTNELIISRVDSMLKGRNIQNRKVIQRFIEFGFLVSNIASETPRKFMLRDEGVLQKIASCSVGMPDDDEGIIKEFVEEISLPQYMIYFDVLPEVSLERIKKRGLPYRLRGKSDAELLTFIRDYKKKLDIICESAASKGVLLYQVDTTDCEQEEMLLKASDITGFLLASQN